MKRAGAKYAEIITLLILLLEILALILNVNGIHNSGLLIDAGQKIIHKENPFIPMQPYGTSPSILFWLIDKFSFSGFNNVNFILINLCGLYLCIKFIFTDYPKMMHLQILTLVLITSPTRALVGNVQHTGIIYFFIFLAYSLQTKNRSTKNNVIPFILYRFVIVFSLVMAIEIKWQIAIPFIICWIFKERDFALGFSVIGLLILLRAFIDLWVGRILELDQLEVWKVQRSDHQAIIEQVSFWKVITRITSSEIDWFQISFILYLLLILANIYFVFQNGSRNSLVFAIFIPISIAYLHLYDVVIISILAGFLCMRFITTRGVVFSISLLILPTKFSNSSEIVKGVVLLFAILLILFFNRKVFSLLLLAGILLESAFAAILVILISSLNFDLEYKVSLQLTLVFAILAVLISKIIIDSRDSNKVGRYGK